MRRRKAEAGGQRSEIGGPRPENSKGEKVRRSEKQKIRRTLDRDRWAEVGGQRTDGWMIRMNRMLGWKMPGDKDKVKTEFDIKIKNTYDLINKIKNNELPDKIMINVHPQRWNDKFVPWFIELVSQNAKNVVKKQIIKFRDLRI